MLRFQGPGILIRIDNITTGQSTLRFSIGPLAGASGSVSAHRLALSADGQVVTFASAGSNHVDGLTYTGPAGAFQTYVFENGSVSLISKDVVDPLATGNGTTSSLGNDPEPPLSETFKHRQTMASAMR